MPRALISPDSIADRELARVERSFAVTGSAGEVEIGDGDLGAKLPVRALQRSPVSSSQLGSG